MIWAINAFISLTAKKRPGLKVVLKLKGLSYERIGSLTKHVAQLQKLNDRKKLQLLGAYSPRHRHPYHRALRSESHRTRKGLGISLHWYR